MYCASKESANPSKSWSFPWPAHTVGSDAAVKFCAVPAALTKRHDVVAGEAGCATQSIDPSSATAVNSHPVPRAVCTGVRVLLPACTMNPSVVPVPVEGQPVSSTSQRSSFAHPPSDHIVVDGPAGRVATTCGDELGVLMSSVPLL